MNWKMEVAIELQRLQPGENPGRTRTIARRMAGIALQEYYKTSSVDYMKVLQSALTDESVPKSSREAIERLTARIEDDFTSPSVDPVNDALVVVDFVQDLERKRKL